jgi:hypothetical protein
MTPENLPQQEPDNNPTLKNSEIGSASLINALNPLDLTASSKHEDIGLIGPGTSSTAVKPKPRSPLLPERTDPVSGQILFDDYSITGKVGSGRGSLVYRALQKSTDQIVVLKTTRYEQPAIRRAFTNAAKTMMALKHDNIVSSLALLHTSQKRPYYVMEMLDGVTLVELIDATGGLDNIEEIAEIVLQICDALDYAHKNKITHEYLSPDEIMLVDTGGEQIEVKLLDFGFTEVIDAMDNIEGKSPSNKDGIDFESRVQNDIFMLAQILISIVTGQAIPDAIPEYPYRLNTTNAADPRFAAERLENVINQAIEPDLDFRFASISEFRTAFESWMERTAEAAKVEDAREEQAHQELIESVNEDNGFEVEAKPEAADTAPSLILPKSKRDGSRTAIRLQVIELANLRKTQVDQEDSLAVQLTGVFAIEGARQSPVKTFATITAKLVAAVAIGLLSMTFLILNWDKIGEIWVKTSTQLSSALPGKHNEELRRQRLEDEAIMQASAAQSRRTTTGSGQTSGSTDVANPATAAPNQTPAAIPAPQKRFRYEENPAYRHWVLKDVGPKRRLTSSGN